MQYYRHNCAYYPAYTLPSGIIFLILRTTIENKNVLSSFILEDSGSAENKEELLFSHDKLLLASILRPLHQVTKEMLV